MEYYFYDPKHGGCLRIIRKVDKNLWVINGAYGNDEKQKGHWVAFAKKIKDKNYNLEVDFSHKKVNHAQIYKALWKNRKIHWQDGNTWIQMYS